MSAERDGAWRLRHVVVTRVTAARASRFPAAGVPQAPPFHCRIPHVNSARRLRDVRRKPKADLPETDADGPILSRKPCDSRSDRTGCDGRFDGDRRRSGERAIRLFWRCPAATALLGADSAFPGSTQSVIRSAGAIAAAARRRRRADGRLRIGRGIAAAAAAAWRRCGSGAGPAPAAPPTTGIRSAGRGAAAARRRACGIGAATRRRSARGGDRDGAALAEDP
jgi:hypothetical protein